MSITTMNIYSENKEVRKPRGVNTFYKLVLKTIRDGGEDYLFNQKQVEYLKTLLKENEELVIRNDEDYIIVKLKEE